MAYKGIVITHDEMGIYLGNALGFAFWSLVESAEQDSACTFADEEQARKHTDKWQDSNDNSVYKYVEVFTADEFYATVAELTEAGMGDMLGDMDENRRSNIAEGLDADKTREILQAVACKPN
jgi:hypothetical protein